MSDYAPFTGFGDDPATSIKFTILLPADTLPDWTGGPRLTVKRIPGGNRVNVRNTGRNPYQISLRLALPTLADMEALDAAQGTTGTLRYVWGLTKSIGGSFEHLGDGRDYVAIPGVRLMELADAVIEPETYEVTATFLKAAP